MAEWSQPKLVVLGRATPEESVLEVCKNHEVASQYASGYPSLQQAVACRGQLQGRHRQLSDGHRSRERWLICVRRPTAATFAPV